MSNYSKYNEIRNRRPPKKKRTIKIDGSGQDDDKWYRCWYCGFPNNIDRNALGDGEGIDYPIGQLLNDTGRGQGAYVGYSGSVVLIPDVSTLPVFDEQHEVVGEAVAGCSFCGSLNYR